MVNYGVSRGCESCKRGHKKCDETRPSCNRCIKSRRICPGYPEDVDLIFRRYDSGPNFQPFRPSNLVLDPKSVLISPTPTEIYRQIPQASTVEQTALKVFFYNFCVASKNRSLSRGYLDGLEPLVAHAGPSSDLAKASKIVAFASFSNKVGNQILLHKSRILYSELLSSFQKTIFNAETTAESLMTAVLLGLYEMITATETHPGDERSHSQGVTAILATGGSPFDLLNGAKLFQRSNPLLLKGCLRLPANTPLLCAPQSNSTIRSLDACIANLRPLLRKGRNLLSCTSTPLEDIRRFMQEAKASIEEWYTWPVSQPLEWTPRTIPFTGQRRAKFIHDIKWWPGRIEAYFDLYVAAVLNSYRKTRLMILDIIIRCAIRLGEQDKYQEEQKVADELAECIMASLPYHLIDNLEIFLNKAGDRSDIVVPGKSIGGLLIMHHLYVTANLSVVSPEICTQMKECLAWIGTHMGIGQATLLHTDTSTFPTISVVDGYVLIWAGMLIQPV